MSNTTIIENENAIFLYSYQTPVVMIDKVSKTVYKTDTKHSVTTSKHIRKFLDSLVDSTSDLYMFSGFTPKVMVQDDLTLAAGLKVR